MTHELAESKMTDEPSSMPTHQEPHTRHTARQGNLVEMGESRTPRPEPFTGNHYERVRWFVVDRPDGHRHSAGRSSHVSLDRAWLRTTRRLSGSQPRCMTLPLPARRRQLPRSPYRLSGEGESRLAVARYFFLPRDLRGPVASSARVPR